MKTAHNTYILTWEIDIDNFFVGDVRTRIKQLQDMSKTTDLRHSLMQHTHPTQDAAHVIISINNWELAHEGDRFYIYLVSQDERITNRIVASGFFASEPYFDGRWKTLHNQNAYTIDGEWDVVIYPMHGMNLLMQPTLELQFPDYDWSGETPDFILDHRTALLLEEKWYKYLSTESIKLQPTDFWCQSSEGFAEMYSWINKDGNHDMGLAMAYMNHLKVVNKYLKK